MGYPNPASGPVIEHAGEALTAVVEGNGLAFSDVLHKLSVPELEELSEAAQFLAETCDIGVRTRPSDWVPMGGGS